MNTKLNILLASFAVLGLGVGCGPANDEDITPEPVVLSQGDVFQFETTFYVYAEGTSRGIPTSEIFTGCGYSWDNVKVIQKADFDLIPQGPVLADTTDCPK